MKVEDLKKRLNMLKCYDLSEKTCLECMQKQKYKWLSDFYKKHLQTNKRYRENVLRLFDYCENDHDRELLWLRYVLYEDYFDIAHKMGYSERAIYIHFKRAFERLEKNTENIPDFDF